MKSLFAFAFVFVAMNVTHASECKKLCSEQYKECKEVVKIVGKEMEMAVAQSGADKATLKEFKKELKHMSKQMNATCKDQKDVCKSTCNVVDRFGGYNF